jgi:hypothetical protein
MAHPGGDQPCGHRRGQAPVGLDTLEGLGPRGGNSLSSQRMQGRVDNQRLGLVMGSRQCLRVPVLPTSWTLSAALRIVSPARITGSSTCVTGGSASPLAIVVRGIVSRPCGSTPTHVSGASCGMGCLAVSCASGMMACSPTGTRRRPCVAAGSCWASRPTHLDAAPRAWGSGCKRSRGSTARNVRTVAPGHLSGSRCPLC